MQSITVTASGNERQHYDSDALPTVICTAAKYGATLPPNCQHSLRAQSAIDDGVTLASRVLLSPGAVLTCDEFAVLTDPDRAG